MSKIEWTEKTWNPIVGRLTLAPDHILNGPLRRRKPTRWFVNSMGDLFHEDIPDHWIDRVFAVMALTPQHTFQVLTKRSKRMRMYFQALEISMGDGCLQERLAAASGRMVEDGDNAHDVVLGLNWPLPNVWLGVSAEDQNRADERIPDLLATPAAIRFVSAEPLLGPVDFCSLYHDAVGVSHRGFLPNASEPDDYRAHSPKLDWIIVGGESGPGARPMNPNWARSVRDQCNVAGVPFFFKQWGEYVSGYANEMAGEIYVDEDTYGPSVEGHMVWSPKDDKSHWLKVGKRRAGRMLDGREWSEMPALRTQPETTP